MSSTVRARPQPEPRPAGVLGAALASGGLYFLARTVPPLGLLVFASPFPVLVQRLRGGLTGGLLAAVLAASMVAGVLPQGGGAGNFLVVLLLPTLLIGEALARGYGLRRGCLWSFGVLLAELGGALFFAGPRLHEAIRGFFDYPRSPQVIEGLRANGYSPAEIDRWLEWLASVQRAIEVVYPAVLVIVAALLVLANAWLLRTYLARRDPGWLEGGEFETLRWPLGLAALFVLAGGSVAVAPLRPLAYNLLLVVAFFYVLQGLAVLAYYVHRLAVPWLLRAGLVALVLLNPFSPQILVLVGLFDTWLDLRRFARPAEGSGR
jgi:uncharacterized protein YybS (DUF2232 family)